jgi:hypothetical protein
VVLIKLTVHPAVPVVVVVGKQVPVVLALLVKVLRVAQAQD